MWDIYDSHCTMLPQIPLTLLVALLGRNWSPVTKKIIISSAPGQSHVNELNYLVSDLIDKLVARIVTQKQWKRKCFLKMCHALSFKKLTILYASSILITDEWLNHSLSEMQNWYFIIIHFLHYWLQDEDGLSVLKLMGFSYGGWHF